MNKFSKLFFAGLLCCTSVFAQTSVQPIAATPPKGWHLLDEATTGYYGISLDKAYTFLKDKKPNSTPVVVAVIDGGIDTTQEDLKSILWTNAKEIPGNGIDDDRNGYIDDVHGWNFLGGKDGRNVKQDSYEAARVYYNLKSKWGSGTVDTIKLSAKEKEEYETFLAAKDKTVGAFDPQEAEAIKEILPQYIIGDSILRKELGKEEYTGNDVKNYAPKDLNAQNAKGFLMSFCEGNKNYDITNQQTIEFLSGEIKKGDAAKNPPPNYRQDVVKDDETNINDRFYGNNDIMTGTPFHGTHCSGIIGAIRDNDKGIKGVANNVRIMMVRAVPDGDEHDKDIANAIRYAVDNGARVISMSFGKDFSPQKKWVDDAFKYAESKNVLLVHAAGNDNKDVDTESNFPNPVYADGKGRASNVITVGASGDPKNGGLVAKFSNYGKKEVDVFAPGVNIYSTVPGVSSYGNASGTSMACPVVAGVAALLLEYYPKLSPQQLKLAIEKSTQAPKMKVKKPGTDDSVDMSELSRTGGIVNAYEAVKYASTLKPAATKTILPKSKIKTTKKG